jgi:gamma-glutamylcyclotransferase (GGCT)/AIG2-like uncharacterized protein YtfP
MAWNAALVGLSAEDWNAAAQVVLAVGTVSAALSAAFTYRGSKRAEAARWMVSLFSDFYKDPDISRARELLEYDCFDVAGPLLELRVLDRHVSLSDDERERLRDIDLVLNFLEQLLYLEAEGHVLKRDRDVFFEYWFDRLKLPESAAVRRYLSNCGYERCSALLDLPNVEFFAAYGSLMSGQGGEEEDTARRSLVPLGPCRLNGTLFSRGSYPALIPGPGRVEGELFRVEDKNAFRGLDELEHYDPERRAKSMYRRRCIRLADPPVDAWVYYWNESTESLVPVPDGSWTAWQTSRRI